MLMFYYLLRIVKLYAQLDQTLKKLNRLDKIFLYEMDRHNKNYLFRCFGELQGYCLVIW